MLGTRPICSMPICDTDSDGMISELLTFVEIVSAEFIAIRVVSEILEFVQTADGYTNSFSLSETLVFTESAVAATPTHVTVSESLSFLEGTVFSVPPLNQTVSETLTLTESWTENLKFGQVSESLSLSESWTDNQHLGTIAEILLLTESLTQITPIYATVSESVSFAEATFSSPGLYEVIEQLELVETHTLNQIIVGYVCDCLYLSEKIHRIIEDTVEETLTVTELIDENVIFETLVFAEEATSNLIASTCCISAYIADREIAESLTLTEVVSSNVIYTSTVSESLTLLNSITRLL